MTDKKAPPLLDPKLLPVRLLVCTKTGAMGHTEVAAVDADDPVYVTLLTEEHEDGTDEDDGLTHSPLAFYKREQASAGDPAAHARRSAFIVEALNVHKLVSQVANARARIAELREEAAVHSKILSVKSAMSVDSCRERIRIYEDEAKDAMEKAIAGVTRA